jgi:hypothetical protein
MKLSSIGKKIVVFSDVHNEINKTKKIIEKESADYNICLGDWFDSFTLDDTYHYRLTAEYLVNEFLPKENNITLFGNHDLHYFFKSQYTMCSGFERRKHEAISEIINYSFVDKFKWYIWIDSYLCTHAGLHRNWIDPKCNNNKDIDNFLQKESKRADKALIGQKEHWFYEAGRSRGGRNRQGGIVWLDFNDEFECKNGLNQIVGHTPQRNGTCTVLTNSENSDNMCIDCFQNQYLVIQDEKINIKKYIDL